MTIQPRKVVIFLTNSKPGGVDRFVTIFKELLSSEYEITVERVNNPVRFLAFLKPLVRIIPPRLKDFLARLIFGAKAKTVTQSRDDFETYSQTTYLFTHPRQLRQVNLPNTAQRVVMYHDSSQNLIKSGVMAELQLELRPTDTLVMLTHADAEALKPLVSCNLTFVVNPYSNNHEVNLQVSEIENNPKIAFTMLTRFVAQKRVDTALKAWRISNLDKEKYELNIYGEGWLKVFSIVRVKIFRMRNVHIHKYTHTPSAVLEKSNFLLNSSSHEGLPFSYLEALGKGVPIVASPTGPGADDIVSKQCGLLASTGRPVDLATQITKASSMGAVELDLVRKKSRDLLASYQPINVRSKWLEIINSKLPQE
jgi:glycosyltransferase involved in cell wall biosynthesis